MQKIGEVIEKFYHQEPLSQNGSDLHESSLTVCTFKLGEIMVPEGWGVQEEKLFLHVYIGKILLK
jgi:hypothetical protein